MIHVVFVPGLTWTPSLRAWRLVYRKNDLEGWGVWRGAGSGAFWRALCDYWTGAWKRSLFALYIAFDTHCIQSNKSHWKCHTSCSREFLKSTLSWSFEQCLSVALSCRQGTAVSGMAGIHYARTMNLSLRSRVCLWGSGIVGRRRLERTETPVWGVHFVRECCSVVSRCSLR